MISAARAGAGGTYKRTPKNDQDVIADDDPGELLSTAADAQLAYAGGDGLLSS